VVSSEQDRGIFISYRREDTAAQAGRLYDHLSERFGEDLVFMDVEAIAVGTDFTKSVIEAVSGCHVLIVLIGRNWLTVTDSKGRRRIDNSDDWVRVEVEAALQRDILVAPVLVDGAALPLANDLPLSLQPLIRRQALEFTHASFRSQVKVLIAAIEEAFRVAQVQSTAVTMTGWRLKLLEHADTKSTFRLWSGKEDHEIAITLGMASDEIYVDGKYVCTVTSLTGQKISLSSHLKTKVILQAKEVETGRYVTGASGPMGVRRIGWLIVTIGDEVLKYSSEITDEAVEAGEDEVVEAEIVDDESEYTPGPTSKDTEWRLDLVSDEGFKKTFRLSSDSETHEIRVKIGAGSWTSLAVQDVIEVDGERVAESGTAAFKTLIFQEIPLTTLGSHLGIPVTIEVGQLDNSKKKYCLTLKIGDQVLRYSTPQYDQAWARAIQREPQKGQGTGTLFRHHR
jgi:hypothetical protein